MNKIKLGISACLIGEKVRYDAGCKLDPFFVYTLGRYVEWVPICPEVESGLSVPREPMQLQGDARSPRLVTVMTAKDYTHRLAAWAEKKIAIIKHQGLCGFVLKSRSPSCGIRPIRVYSENGAFAGSAPGIFAQALSKSLPSMPIEDESGLHKLELRENFIDRVFVFMRWKKFIAADADLADFHSRHELIIMSHSIRHSGLLRGMAAKSARSGRRRHYEKYFSTLIEGLRLSSTIRKNTAVLRHAVHYLDNKLSVAETRELNDAIEKYYKGLSPLIIPTTIIMHYAKKYGIEYLKRQYYLNPEPAALMLKNHA